MKFFIQFAPNLKIFQLKCDCCCFRSIIVTAGRRIQTDRIKSPLIQPTSHYRAKVIGCEYDAPTAVLTRLRRLHTAQNVPSSHLDSGVSMDQQGSILGPVFAQMTFC
jgi:hypothetical protein